MVHLPDANSPQDQDCQLHPRLLVAGLGSPYGDDHVGWFVCEQLAILKFNSQADNSNNIDIQKLGSPTQLLDHLDGIDKLIVVDACKKLDMVGQILRFGWPACHAIDRRLRNVDFIGTHDLGLLDVLNLADSLKLLPNAVWLCGITIDPDHVELLPYQPLSPAVSTAAHRLANELAQELCRRST